MGVQNIFTKYRHCLRQSSRFQHIQVLLDRFCGILEAQSVILCRIGDDTWRQIQQVQNELVWMLRFNAERCHRPGRKVAQVDRDDDIRTRANRRRQEMPVVRVGELQARDQLLVARYQRIVGMLGP